MGRADGVDFTNASFADAEIRNSDLRGATGFALEPSTRLTSTILPDGEIVGSGAIVRDHPIPVRIARELGDVTFRVAIERAWQSPIEILVKNDGRLDFELFLPQNNVAELMNQSFQIVDWQIEDRVSLIRPVPFNSPLRWDTSRFREEGVVTLLGDARADINENGQYDESDFFRFCRLRSRGRYIEEGDLNSNGALDDNDLATLQMLLGVLPGDFDLDGTVSFTDFLILSENFGERRSGSSGGWVSGNADCSENVDFADFLLLAGSFGETTTGGVTQRLTQGASLRATVPEPQMSLWLIFLLLTVTRQRHSLRPRGDGS